MLKLTGIQSGSLFFDLFVSFATALRQSSDIRKYIHIDLIRSRLISTDELQVTFFLYSQIASVDSSIEMGYITKVKWDQPRGRAQLHVDRFTLCCNWSITLNKLSKLSSNPANNHGVFVRKTPEAHIFPTKLYKINLLYILLCVRPLVAIINCAKYRISTVLWRPV